MEKIAIIDLGSNSIRLDIVEILPEKKYRYCLRRRELVKLSEGMGATRRLQPPAMERTIEALTAFKREIETESVRKVLAFATAAVRKAENKEEFCAAAAKTGIAIQVISGEQEAEYDLLGVLGTLDIRHCVLVDTGGGSTEIIGIQNGETIGKISLPLGAVALTEKFFCAGESPEALQAAEKFCREEINHVSFLSACRGMPLVGLGGSIAAVALASARLFGKKVELHGYTMPWNSVVEIKNKIFQTPVEERGRLGIEKGRAETVLCGLLPVLAVGTAVSAQSLQICTSGLREGVLFSYLRAPEKYGNFEKM